jgi:hypothetical protein
MQEDLITVIVLFIFVVTVNGNSVGKHKISVVWQRIKPMKTQLHETDYYLAIIFDNSAVDTVLYLHI